MLTFMKFSEKHNFPREFEINLELLISLKISPHYDIQESVS
jgi:hypothetical protein